MERIRPQRRIRIRRKDPSVTLSVLILFLTFSEWSSSVPACSAAFGIYDADIGAFWRPVPSSPPPPPLSATREHPGTTAASSSSSASSPKEEVEDSPWSAIGGEEVPAQQQRSGSRFGLRKRVKAVLKKAKNRTGLSNFNTEESAAAASSSNNNPGSIVAETASIGGFDVNDTGADFVFKRPGADVNASNEQQQPTINNNYDGTPTRRNDTQSPLVPLSSVVSSSTTTTSQTASSDGTAKFSAADAASSSRGGGRSSSSRADVDAILNSEPIDPLPFTLPNLSDEQLAQLKQGERVQEQSKMGREGSGYVVMDVKAPPYVVWECLLDFEAYPEYIGTVKSMRMFTNTHMKSSYIAEKPVLPGTGRETRHYGISSQTRAKFVLSKFKLNIAAIHKYHPHPDGHYMVFSLDRACKNVVMQDAKGIWYTQSNPDGRGEEYTRVWLLCEVKISRLLPSFIVDYAAKRAMPRATTWLPPLVEEKSKLWLTEPPNGNHKS